MFSFLKKCLEASRTYDEEQKYKRNLLKDSSNINKMEEKNGGKEIAKTYRILQKTVTTEDEAEWFLTLSFLDTWNKNKETWRVF